MAALDNVLTILDKFPLWRRMKEAPEKLDALEGRVVALEEKLGDTWPADVYRFCGKRAVRLHESRRPNDQGIIREFWRCDECDEFDERSHKVK